MKKTLAAAAVAALFSGAALAAPSVTLSGYVDTGFGYQHQKVTGESATDTFSMESGINETSRWGLSGEEEIGGVTVSFNLVNEFNSDDGTTADDDNRLFGREAQLSVAGRYGVLSAGRMGALGAATGTYDTIFAIGDSFDGGDWDVFGLAASGVYDNVLTYQSPKFAGLQLTAQYSFKANSKDAGTEGKSSSDRYAGASLSYELGNFQTVLGYEHMDRGNNADREISRDGNLITLGANYDFEDIAQVFVMGQYFKGWDEVAGVNHEDLGVSASKGFKGWGAHVGAIFPVWGGDLTTGLYYTDAKLNDAEFGAAQASADAKYYGAAVRYAYPLSKRTSVYTGASYGQSKVSGADLDTYKVKTTSVYMGLTHSF